MEMFIAGFLLCTVAVMIYLSSDNSKFKQCLELFQKVTAENQTLKTKQAQQETRIAELAAQVSEYRKAVSAYKEEIDLVQEHAAKLREGQQDLRHRQDVLKARSIIPRSIAISIIDSPKAPPPPIKKTPAQKRVVQ